MKRLRATLSTLDLRIGLTIVIKSNSSCEEEKNIIDFYFKSLNNFKSKLDFAIFSYREIFFREIRDWFEITVNATNLIKKDLKNLTVILTNDSETCSQCAKYANNSGIYNFSIENFKNCSKIILKGLNEIGNNFTIFLNDSLSEYKKITTFAESCDKEASNDTNCGEYLGFNVKARCIFEVRIFLLF